MSKARKRFYAVIVGGIVAAGLYLGAYFACVSIQYGHIYGVKAQSVVGAFPHYNVSQRWLGFTYYFFMPANSLDATFFRRSQWDDWDYVPEPRANR